MTSNQRISPMPLANDAGTARPPARVPGRSRLLVVGIAAVAAVAAWAILVPVAGLTLDARQNGVMHVGAVAVFVSSAIAALAGWGVLTILERRTVRAQNIWTLLAMIVFVTSLSSPLDRGIGLGAKLGLATLHLVVAAVVIPGLRRTTLSAADRC